MSTPSLFDHHLESSLALIGAMRDCGASFFQISTARELLACGADPNVRDAFGLTPLMWAAREGSAPALALFSSLGDHALRSNEGRSALHHAAHAGHIGLSLALCSEPRCYDPQERDDAGLSSIDLALHGGHASLADALVLVPRRSP